jgi:hypothetical protein
MEETMKNAATEELNEQTTLTEEEVTTTEQGLDEDKLKETFNAQFKKLQRQSMLLDAQTILEVVRNKIRMLEVKPGKRTMNDYKRFIKDLKNFCDTGLSRKVNADGETEPIEEESAVEETVQN